MVFEALKIIMPTAQFNSDVWTNPLASGSLQNPLPPFIAVHSRRNDFDTFCKGNMTNCFTPVSTYAKEVETVRAELIERKPSLRNVQIPVVFFSDEPRRPNGWFIQQFHRPPGSSEAFWKDVGDMGWLGLDHEAPELNSDIRWGSWASTLIDIVVMSHSSAFVGTKQSTFSLITAKRVNKWWNGPTRMVSPVREDRN